jgi:hypothetical protein
MESLWDSCLDEAGAREKKIVQSPPIDYQLLTKVAWFQSASCATAFPEQFGAIFSVTERRAGAYGQHVPPLDKTHRVETQIFFGSSVGSAKEASAQH